MSMTKTKAESKVREYQGAIVALYQMIVDQEGGVLNMASSVHYPTLNALRDELRQWESVLKLYL